MDITIETQFFEKEGYCFPHGVPPQIIRDLIATLPPKP
jgi:hypothetical protein